MDAIAGLPSHKKSKHLSKKKREREEKRERREREKRRKQKHASESSDSSSSSSSSNDDSSSSDSEPEVKHEVKQEVHRERSTSKPPPQTYLTPADVLNELCIIRDRLPPDHFCTTVSVSMYMSVCECVNAIRQTEMVLSLSTHAFAHCPRSQMLIPFTRPPRRRSMRLRIA